MRHSRALLVVLVVSSLMYFSWEKYKSVIDEQNQPSLSLKKFNDLQKTEDLNFSLRDLNGESVQLSSMKNKIVILNFWATWCEPCIDEFPSFIKLLKIFKGQVVLVAVSADENVQDIQKFLKIFKIEAYKKRKLPIYIIWDKKRELASRYGTQSLPESYIIRGGKELLGKVIGVERWHSVESVAYFKSLL